MGGSFTFNWEMVGILAVMIFAPPMPGEPIPVILDTDIGVDIDDTWALALLLSSPELDLQLVVTDSHNTEGKAQIAAKFLETIGRSDIPVGIGKKMDDEVGNQYPWAEDYNLESYPGTIHRDGVGAMIDCIMLADHPITLIAIGPTPNIEEAVKREPGIVEKARIVAMSGSVYRGYRGPAPDPEFNVTQYPAGTEVMYSAGWDVTIAPLDTAGLITLQGDAYQKVYRSANPIVKTLIENYRVWAGNKDEVAIRSSTLFDAVAVYLSYSTEWCEMKDVRLRVTSEGYTVVDDRDGSLVHAAVNWKDRAAFEAHLVERLSGVNVKP